MNVPTVTLVAMEGYYWRYLWLQWRDITGSTCGCNGGVLLAVPLVALEGYYSKFILFTGATLSQKC
jgi:hypothetical protein